MTIRFTTISATVISVGLALSGTATYADMLSGDAALQQDQIQQRMQQLFQTGERTRTRQGDTSEGVMAREQAMHQTRSQAYTRSTSAGGQSRSAGSNGRGRR